MSPEPRLVLVAGPSGAGKDTLIALAAARFAREPRMSFPRRCVTRTADGSEDHETMSEREFDRVRDAGGFALHWQAHGLRYGIPRPAFAAGGVVVCNVSRAIVAAARAQFSWVRVVLVDAPVGVRAARVAARGREPADAGRLSRIAAATAIADADLVINNDGTPEDGALPLIGLLLGALEV